MFSVFSFGRSNTMSKTGKALKALILSFAFGAGLFLSASHAKAAGNIAINSTNFPDANFRNYISSTLDTVKAHQLKNSGVLTAKWKIPLT